MVRLLEGSGELNVEGAAHERCRTTGERNH
jgi:hypothetical protein